MEQVRSKLREKNNERATSMESLHATQSQRQALMPLNSEKNSTSNLQQVVYRPSETDKGHQSGVSFGLMGEKTGNGHQFGTTHNIPNQE